MPESFQLERIFVKLFLRDVRVHFGQKYQVDSQGIKIYPVDDGESSGLDFAPMFGLKHGKKMPRL